MQKKWKVIYEDNHLIIVNKSANLLVQGDQTKDETLTDLVKAYLKKKYNKKGNVFCGVIHRLDRPVSGVVALAKTSKALERMTKLFRENKIDKTYLAVVGNMPEEDSGTLTHWLEKDTNRNFVRAYSRPRGKNTKEATLNYKFMGRIGRYNMLKINPITGRPHQIRVQLSKLGTPIRGDLKYGYPNPEKDASICLHAYRLRFIHPVRKEEVTFTAPLPEGIWQGFRDVVAEAKLK